MASDSTLGRYELRGIVGDGGFATVYRAWDPLLGREVALKALLPHLSRRPDVHERFLTEARALAPLHHPNIVEFYDVGEVDGLPFFTMEFIDGPTIAQFLAVSAPPPEQVARLVRSLGSAIDYLHAAGIVHRDIKASNVMLDPDGRIVLMDFGIARALDQTQHTRTGASLGTPEAMAPEQVRGLPAGPEADIYALGVLTFQLLSGRPPFIGDTAYVLHAQAYEPPPDLRLLRPDLSPGLYAAIEQALAKDPAQRPASAGAFARAVVAELSAVWQPQQTPVPDVAPIIVAPSATPELPGPADVAPASIDADEQRPLAAARLGDGSRRGHRRLIVWTGLVAAATAAVIALGVFLLAQGSQAKAVHGQESRASAAASRSATAAASVMPAVVTPPPPPTATPSPTATPAPTPAPIPAPMAADSFATDNELAWGQGHGDLHGCVQYHNASSGTTIALRVAPADDTGNPVVPDAVAPLQAAPAGQQCLAVPGAAAQTPGDYQAVLYDIAGGQWRSVVQTTVTVPPPLAVSNVTLTGAAVWGRGTADLQLCADYDHAAPGDGLRIRVTTQADPSTLAVPDSDLQSFSAATGNQCFILAASAARPANDYLATLFDENWQDRGSATFTVLPPPRPVVVPVQSSQPAPVAPAQVSVPASAPAVAPVQPAPAPAPVVAPVAPVPVQTQTPSRIPAQPAGPQAVPAQPPAPAPSGPSRIPAQPVPTR